MVSVSWMDCCFVMERTSIQMQPAVTQPYNRSWKGNGYYEVVKFQALDIRSLYLSALTGICSDSVLLGLFHTGNPYDGDLSPRDRRLMTSRTPTTMSICRRDVGPTVLIISEYEHSAPCLKWKILLLCGPKHK
jgi:hypothetical protein